MAGAGKQEPELCSIVCPGESRHFARLRAFLVSAGVKGSFAERPSWQSVPPTTSVQSPRDCTEAMAEKQMENLCSSSTPF